MENALSSNQPRIAVSSLADDLQTRKQSLFKVMKRLGIADVKQRDPDRGNQLISTITEQEAERIKADFRKRVSSDDIGEPLMIDQGILYVIQLEPEHDPRRVKFGFTTDLDGRLQKHRCSAPFACYVKTWPCRRQWESTAIDCLALGAERLHTEVYRLPSLKGAITRGDQFFALMPPVNADTNDNL